MSRAAPIHGEKSGLAVRARRIRWGIVVILTAIAGAGFTMLYSAADGSVEPWAARHLMRYAGCLVVLLAIAVADIRLCLRLAYPVYFAALGMLAGVELVGLTGMGARRWIDLGPIQLQPSEIMKVALVLALARYFHGLKPAELSRPLAVAVPALMVLAPVALIIRQPDLGTAALMIAGGVAVSFAAGVRLSVFAAAAAAALALVPVGWSMLHDYQRQRIFTFLDPESDPLGAGYHIIQSTIALGSGGVFGKGLLRGTQSHLDFVPERQTDFVFAVLAEELGLVGALALLALYAGLLVYGLRIAFACRHPFGRLVALGVTVTFFLYVFANVAMVVGLLPVVGVPLPLVSYGGTAMLAVMAGFGLILNVHINRDVRLGRYAAES